MKDSLKYRGAVLWYTVSYCEQEVGRSSLNDMKKGLPYLPVYNARPCIIRIPISDQILRKKKNKLLNKKVKLYNIIYFN